MLVGEPPQTRHLGTKCPIGLSAGPPLSGLFLIGASAGEIDKVVNVALRRHQLPHLLLSGAVLCGEGFFALRQLPAFLFQGIHFGELGPVQKIVHGGLGLPVVGQLRLMLGQIFLAVLGRLVAVEHGPGFCVLYYGPHERGGMGQLLLDGPELSGQGVLLIHRRVGLGRQLVIVGQAVLPEKLESGPSVSSCKSWPAAHSQDSCPVPCAAECR